MKTVIPNNDVERAKENFCLLQDLNKTWADNDLTTNHAIVITKCDDSIEQDAARYSIRITESGERYKATKTLDAAIQKIIGNYEFSHLEVVPCADTDCGHVEFSREIDGVTWNDFKDDQGILHTATGSGKDKEWYDDTEDALQDGTPEQAQRILAGLSDDELIELHITRLDYLGGELAAAALNESQVISRSGDWQDTMILIYLVDYDESPDVPWLRTLLTLTNAEIKRRKHTSIEKQVVTA